MPLNANPIETRPVTAAASRSRSTFDGDSANLDFIRAVAVLCVFFGHLHEILTGAPADFWWHIAQIGVLIFFVHTSFVLMLSLERTPLEGRILLFSFYLRRFFRLYPLSMLCVTVAFVLRASPDIGERSRDWTWMEYLSNLTLTTNLTFKSNMVGGLWTLPIEAQMYLLLPFLFWLTRRRSIWFGFALWAGAIGAALVQPQLSGRLNMLAYAPCFVAGVVAWRLSWTTSRQLSGTLWPAAFLASWVVFLIASRENAMYYRWTFCLVLAVLIPRFKEIPWPILKRASLVVAKYSYGIYLSHFGVMLFSFGLPIAAPLQWMVFLSLAVAAPVAMYHWVEHPFIQLGQRVVRTSQAR